MIGSTIRRVRQRPGATTATLLVTIGFSIASKRREREVRLQRLPLAQTKFTEDELRDLKQTMRRTGLMGTSLPGAKSVKEELAAIRKWHLEHGYRGGIVLRELTKPLFRLYDKQPEDETAEQDALEAPEFDVTDILRLARRECYYLYYELECDGQLRQQIFCRGTTLSVDILTCLQAWWVYDDELDCRVHCGFRNHADRMLDDIIPLLNPNDGRATIEISGHSLGGAVALLLALKLQKRGFTNVVKVRAIASPRFCNAAAAAKLTPLLPKDTLRVEDEHDVVPFLPPFGKHVGSKLWLLSNDARLASMASAEDWTDSVWYNFPFFPSTRNHRIYSYVDRLQRLLIAPTDGQRTGDDDAEPLPS